MYSIVSGIPTHVGHPAASASPSSSYRHLSAPLTPQHHQNPRGYYFQAQEELLLPSASRDVPTPTQAASALTAEESISSGPPFFVVFSGQEPGVFISWYVCVLYSIC